MVNKELAESFSEAHQEEFEQYINSMKKVQDPTHSKEYYKRVMDMYNQEEDESFLDINSWRRV